MPKTRQQDLSVLSAAKNGLVHLTCNDWTRISDQATRISFEAGERIVERGRLTHGEYLILKGNARVGDPVASDFIIDWRRRDLWRAVLSGRTAGERDGSSAGGGEDLLSRPPGIDHSLAANLCRRLREMIDMKQPSSPYPKATTG